MRFSSSTMRKACYQPVLNCSYRCISNLIFQFLCALLVIVGIFILTLWLIFPPYPLSFYVTKASLSRFNMSSTDDILHYNLVLNLMVRNPNRHTGIYYDRIEAEALYGGYVFSTTEVTGFYQGSKQTNYLNVAFNGQNPVVLPKDELPTFDRESELESFSIDVKIYLKVKLKLFYFKTLKSSPEIECDLKLPISVGKGSGSFQTKRCRFDWKHRPEPL